MAVIGGGNPAQADSHYEAALEQERNGFRIGAIEELRKAVANGTNPDHKFKLAYMLDLVGEESENVVIKLGNTSIVINISGTTFVSNLIARNFPDYEQVIPSGESSLLVVDRKNFSESLSRVSVLSSEKYKGVRIITKKDSLNISANNPEKEQGEENLSCEYQGEEIDIAFNENLSKNFVRNLSERLLTWTKKRWVITLTKGLGQKTLLEKQSINKKELLESEKKGGVYKKFKNIFSDGELIEVKKKD